MMARDSGVASLLAGALVWQSYMAGGSGMVTMMVVDSGVAAMTD